jgi:hypothetical protein
MEMTMTREELMNELMAQPFRIAEHAADTLSNALLHQKAINALKDAEAALHIAGFEYLGKTNAEQRDAHIRAQTAAERDEVDAAAARLQIDRIELEKMDREYKSLLAVAGLMTAS